MFAAEALLILAESPAADRGRLEEASVALVRAQPAMAPVFNLANAVLLAVDAAAACRDFLERLRA
jgi:hypothetical protein